MNIPTAIFALIWVAAFIAVLAMAVMGLRATLVPHDDSSWTPPKILGKKNRVGTGPPRRGQRKHDQRLREQRAQKRRRRARKRDQRADLLPPDATISFAAEREAADIDEVFSALDNDLVGLVPVKKKVQEIAALLLVDRARRRFGLDASRPNKLVVILAGYKDRMDEFFGVNPGMSSRIAHHLDFAAYGLDELTAIGQLMMEQSRYYLSGEAERAFRDYSRSGCNSPGSPTPAACATNWSVPGSGTRTGLPPTCTGTGPGTISCASSPRTSSPGIPNSCWSNSSPERGYRPRDGCSGRRTRAGTTGCGSCARARRPAPTTCT